MNPTPPRTAVLLVDLQEEFFTPKGALKTRHLDLSTTLVATRQLTQLARATSSPLFWVRSSYSPRTEPAPLRRLTRPDDDARTLGVPHKDDRIAGAHFGKHPCCEPGSPLAELCEDIQPLIEPHDTILTKTYYSAFVDTDLHQRLQEQNIDTLVFGGVLAHTCVLASIIDAFFLGYTCVVASDTVDSFSPKQRNRALQLICKHYGTSHTNLQLASSLWQIPMPPLTGLGAGDSALFYNILPDDLSRDAFAHVLDEVEWNDMMHRGGPVPRRIAMQCEMDEHHQPLYRHPADEQPAPTLFTPVASKIKASIEESQGCTLNHCLLQLYPDGASHISPHADKTLDIARGSAIYNYSLGATRTMVLGTKKRKDGKRPKQYIELPHNSLFLLGWETNRLFFHSIKPDRRSPQERPPSHLLEDGQRISLTLRTVATFQTPDGKVYGQGAPAKTLDAWQPPGEGYDFADDANRMLEAFGSENRKVDFDWDASYGGGFHSIDLHILNAQKDAEKNGANTPR